MYKLRNTALDYSKSLLHRTASKLETEPMINGRRLRLRTTMDVPNEWVEKNKNYLDELIKHGVVEIVGAKNEGPTLDENGLKLGGPTLEEFVKAGYSPDAYPPKGWAEVPSPGLTEYREKLKRASEEAARAKAEAEARAKEEAELEAMIAAEEAAKAAQVTQATQVSQQVITQHVPFSDAVMVENVVPAAPGPAGAPTVPPSPPPAAPAAEEKKEGGKKGSGKSKLK